MVDDNAQPRATQVHKLSDEDREGLPTHNLLPERDFSHFDRLSIVARMRNGNFRAHNLQNDMTLLHATREKINLSGNTQINR